MKAKALVQRLAHTIRQLKAKTSSGTLRDVEVEALVERTADTLQEVRVRIIPAY